jgi:hypothetical protein
LRGGRPRFAGRGQLLGARTDEQDADARWRGGLRRRVRASESGAVGYLAIKFLLRFLSNHALRIFAYCRFALAAVVAIVLLSSGT